MAGWRHAHGVLDVMPDATVLSGAGEGDLQKRLGESIVQLQSFLDGYVLA